MHDKDWFEKRREEIGREYKREVRSTVIGGAIGVVVATILGLAFWGGLIYFGFWCLKHFGVL